MKFKLKILGFLIQLKLLRAIHHQDYAAIKKTYFNRLLKKLKKSPFYTPYLLPKPKLEDFPIINKKIFVERFDEINTCGISFKEAYQVAAKAEQSRNFVPMMGDITIGLSSGTSGSRGIFLANENERAKWVALVLDRVIGLSLKRRKIAFFLRANSNLYNATQSAFLEFHFFDLLVPVPDNLNKLEKLQPTVLVAQPSMLVKIAKTIEGKALVINPIKIISVAEVLSPEDTAYLSAVFKQPIHQIYQCTEGFLASTCQNGTLHFNEDFLTIEKSYIDDEKVRFHPIITDMLRTSQPIIRYELNDILIEKQRCNCGSKMMAIEKIEGRADDMLRFVTADNSELEIFPDFFRTAIITSGNDIADYALYQAKRDELYLFIASHNEDAFGLASASILELLKTKNIINVSIYCAPDNGHKPGSKLRRIRNEIDKTG